MFIATAFFSEDVAAPTNTNDEEIIDKIEVSERLASNKGMNGMHLIFSAF